MITTIYVDASFCTNPVKAAGWACWIKNGFGTWRYSGRFKKDVATSTDAEMLAIINAVYVARKVAQTTHYHIVSDCLGAIHILQGMGKYTKRRAKLRRTFLGILSEAKFTFAHVKAHTSNSDPRSWVNRYCDQEAKRHMREHRAERLAKVRGAA